MISLIRLVAGNTGAGVCWLTGYRRGPSGYLYRNSARFRHSILLAACPRNHLYRTPEHLRNRRPILGGFFDVRAVCQFLLQVEAPSSPCMVPPVRLLNCTPF